MSGGVVLCLFTGVESSESDLRVVIWKARERCRELLSQGWVVVFLRRKLSRNAHLLYAAAVPEALF